MRLNRMLGARKSHTVCWMATLGARKGITEPFFFLIFKAAVGSARYVGVTNIIMRIGRYRRLTMKSSSETLADERADVGKQSGKREDDRSKRQGAGFDPLLNQILIIG